MAIIIIPLWCANKIKFKFQALFGLSIFGLFSFIYGFLVGMFSFGIVVIASLIISSLIVKFHDFFLRLFSRNIERIFRFFIAIVLLTITIILILALSSFGIVAIASLISGSFVDLPGFFLRLLEVFTVIVLLTITIIIIPLWCFNKIKLESLLELFVFLSDPNISFKELLQFVFQYILSETFNKTVSYYFEEAESASVGWVGAKRHHFSINIKWWWWVSFHSTHPTLTKRLYVSLNTLETGRAWKNCKTLSYHFIVRTRVPELCFLPVSWYWACLMPSLVSS